MDKITRIHLSKIPYEIGAHAESRLKKYLDEIRGELDADLADEIINDIEVRITEILADRGVKRDDVIVDKDIDAVQEQLGLPEQFNDTEAKDKPKGWQGSDFKKLLRDPDNAYVGGVAGGIGAYFSVDPIFIRLIFVVLTFVYGLGVLLYVLLWLLVPMAKTSSDKLLMKGEPATAQALQRYRSTAERTITNLKVKSALRLIGLSLKVMFTVWAALFVLALLSAIGFGSAILYTQPLHPLYIAYHLNYVMVGLIWLFTITLVGLTIVILLRLWRRGSTAIKVAFIALASLMILTLAGGAVVSPFIVSHYRTLYGGNNFVVALPVQNSTPSVVPTNLNVSAGSNLVVSYVATSQPLHATYKAYPGMRKPNIAIVNDRGNIDVKAGNLTQVVPTCVLNWCRGMYLPVRVTIYGPSLEQFTANGNTELDISGINQSNLTLTAENSSNLSITNSYSDSLNLYALSNSSLDASDETSQTANVAVQNGSYVFGPASNNIKASLPGACDSALLELSQTPMTFSLNGQNLSSQDLSQNNCVNLDSSPPYNSYQFRGPGSESTPVLKTPASPAGN